MNTISDGSGPQPLRPICLLVGILLSASIVTGISAQPTTIVQVDPSTATVVVGQTFTVNITISAVTDLYGWEFKLGWNPDLLEVVEVVEGAFLKQGGETFFTSQTNNTAGYTLVDCTLLGDVSGVDGDGKLASVKFYSESKGNSVLDLFDTKLVSSLETPITHTSNDGNITISELVGGLVDSADKLALLIPYIGLVSTIAAASLATAIYVKIRRNRRGSK